MDDWNLEENDDDDDDDKFYFMNVTQNLKHGIFWFH